MLHLVKSLKNLSSKYLTHLNFICPHKTKGIGVSLGAHRCVGHTEPTGENGRLRQFNS